MQICSNCSSSFDDTKTGLVTTGAGKIVAAVCGECCRDVRIGKIVVRRDNTGAWTSRFVYEQWLPVEVVGDVPD